MPPQVYRLVMLSFCFVFSIGKECGPAEYKTDDGECCPMCLPGSVVRRDCTSESSTTCIPCIRGTYTDEPNGLSKCLQCKSCDSAQGLIFLHDCTTTRNAFCDVKDGFYCENHSKNRECNFATKHSTCTPGQSTKVAGTKTADTLCEACPEGFFSADGINCTAWTKCNFYQWETAKGTKTKDSVCENIPKRSRTFLLIPFSSVFFILLGLLCFTQYKKGGPCTRNPR